jgi:hypothetical protein
MGVRSRGYALEMERTDQMVNEVEHRPARNKLAWKPRLI